MTISLPHGVAINAPGAAVPIRTLQNLARNPNFGGEVMVVGLGCEKLLPERLLPLVPNGVIAVAEPNWTGVAALFVTVGVVTGLVLLFAPLNVRLCTPV